MTDLSYKEIQAKIDELQVLATAARKAEIATAKEKIWDLMDAFGLTVRDLDRSRHQSAKPRTKVAAKYKDPATGQQWTGRGRAPKWLEGRDRSEFLIAQ